MSLVVYLALGAGRIGAARQHAAQLARAGSRVVVVTTDRSNWAVEGVDVHRLTPAGARRFLFRRGSPLAGARLLVAGDAESTPLADRARRRYPDLTVCLEPSAEPDRRPAPADVAVVTPWYPSPNDPDTGAVAVAAAAAAGGRVAILHTEAWPRTSTGLAGKLLGVTLDREIAQTGGLIVEDRPEGELTRVVTPHVADGGYAQRARANVDRLAAALPTGRIEAPVVHAHTGLYGGVVAAALARADARILVTEHDPGLAEVFAERAARELYRTMLARVDRVVCVSESIRARVAGQFPDQVQKLWAGDAPPGAAPPDPVPAPVPISAPAPGADRVVVLAIDPARSHRVTRYVDGARRKGYAVDLIALDPAKWSRHAGDAGVRIFDIGSAEQRRLPRRLHRGLVTNLPRWALGFARARARRLGSPLPEAVTIHAQRGHRSLARAIDGRIYGPWYELIRPRILWRITRRTVVPELDLARTRAVVVHGVPGVTAGWNLARRDPDMVIKTDLTPPMEEASVRP